jgi:arginyl-tRNA synthetase
MMTIENCIVQTVSKIIETAFGHHVSEDDILIQKTRKEFVGDFTIVVFPFVKILKKSPEQAATILGNELVKSIEDIASYNVIKGFLNIVLSPEYWLRFLQSQMSNDNYGKDLSGSGQTVVVEFSSPNTNKPLHLGHVRNNLLGYSISQILEASGNNVVKVNLVNDRGVHICKSMLAWMKFGEGETPESSGKKGDKLVGDYYVRFETALREQAKKLAKEHGIDEEVARKTAPLLQEAQELLRKWELRDPDTISVWEMMNGWVYEGFDRTYKRMGVHFDKIYYESDTYLLGKELVVQGVESGVLLRKEDKSVWADLTDLKLDEKLLLRSDGTSVYMTQDLGTAQLRYDDYKPDKMIYVVGNEQNYHFDVLQKVLKKLDKPYADAIYHLSYGMVELPEGKMKSREGTVVDADELMDEMIETARRMTEELGKTDGFSDEDKEKLYNIIGMGALKYFILKVDPRKNMLFNPTESIDFNGHTGPFIQYTHARIRSIMRTAGVDRIRMQSLAVRASDINEKEKRLLKALYIFPDVVKESSVELSPAILANYLYELAREFNQFYHDYSILNEPDQVISDFRLQLARLTARVIKTGMNLLGIEVPDKM